MAAGREGGSSFLSFVWPLIWDYQDTQLRDGLKLRRNQDPTGQAPVAHTYNPSYSGENQEDHSSKPAWAHSS
jgi:hypothetical protein